MNHLQLNGGLLSAPDTDYIRGDWVRLGFYEANGSFEKKWVVVTVVGQNLEGYLVADIQASTPTDARLRVAFDRSHVLAWRHSPKP